MLYCESMLKYFAEFLPIPIQQINLFATSI